MVVLIKRLLIFGIFFIIISQNIDLCEAKSITKLDIRRSITVDDFFKGLSDESDESNEINDEPEPVTEVTLRAKVIVEYRSMVAAPERCDKGQKMDKRGNCRDNVN